MGYFYFVTFHPNLVKDSNLVQYELVKSSLKQFLRTFEGCFIAGAYELGSRYKELHFHGIFYTPKRYRWFTKLKIPKLRIYSKPMKSNKKDFHRCCRYIHKNKDTELAAPPEFIPDIVESKIPQDAVLDLIPEGDRIALQF